MGSPYILISTSLDGALKLYTPEYFWRPIGTTKAKAKHQPQRLDVIIGFAG
jgi:hypothetical protein